MSRVFSERELREKYRGFARWYDLAEGVPDVLLGVRGMRRRLVGKARGRVLEVAAGTGANLRHYPRGVDPVLLDLSREMIGQAEASRRVQGSAAQLPFRDGTFETVVSTLSLCTFPDPVAALHEMRRVAVVDALILLLEHGRSRVEWIARWQDRRAQKHAEMVGCWWNRRPDRIVREAGLRVLEERRARLGVFHSMVLAPN